MTRIEPTCIDLPSPDELVSLFPFPQDLPSSIDAHRKQAEKILKRQDTRLALLVGPCSIHDPKTALEYADRLQKLAKEVKNFFLVMRLFLEKPRTRGGWKGLLYDPHLNESSDIASGLKISRNLLIEIAKKNVPIATELLEPLALPYFEDLITWGLIGARTSASQPHRQLASGLAFPVGFKNDTRGELDSAMYGILAARMGHSFIYMNRQGKIAKAQTKGNPFTHLVLRGSETKGNFDSESIQQALASLQYNDLEPSLLIDCSHGNSGKDHRRQPHVFETLILQAAQGNQEIAGLMLESHLFPGRQLLGEDPSHLRYGVSITDSCIGWEETETLIRWADDTLG